MEDENASITCTETVSKLEDETFPQGATYPLNSKRLVVGQLWRLATMLSKTRGDLHLQISRIQTNPHNFCIL